MIAAKHPHHKFPIILSVLRKYLSVENGDDIFLERISPEEASALADQALSQLLNDSPAAIRAKIGDEPLPELPATLQLEHLDLEVRTHNCLVQAGFHKRLHKLREWTISQILALPNFGVKSLRDLLVSLDSALALDAQNTIFRADHFDLIEGGDESAVFDEIISRETVQMIRTCCEQKAPLPDSIARLRLPSLPEGLALDKLDFKTRTRNCLRESGMLERSQDLAGRTVRELLVLPNFGKDSLADLLTKLDPYFLREDFTTERCSLTEHSWLREPEQIQLLQMPGETYQLRLTVPVIGGGAVAREAVDDELFGEARLLEEMNDAEMIGGDDPRFGKLLLMIDASAENARVAAAQIVGGVRVPRNPQEVAGRVRELRESITAAISMKLEEELKAVALSVVNEQRWKMAARRSGMDGRGGATLETVGREFGLTRERVRQVCSRFTEALEGRIPYAPALDKVLAYVSERLNDSTDELQSELMRMSLTESSFDLDGLPEIATLFGREVQFAIAEVGTKRAIVASATDPSAEIIFRIARRAIRVWGVATLADVTAQAAEKSPLSHETIRRALVAQPDFRWLDEATGWFWLSSVPRNRLLSRIRKILSVVGRIQVAELRGGVGRDDRMKGFAPPQRVILEVCRQLPWCHVDNMIVRSEPPLDWREELPESEQMLVSVLTEHDSVMKRSELEQECLNRGMNQATFYKYLSYSSFIIKYGLGVYGLRGADVPLGLVESLTPKIKRGRVLKDYGWTDNGKIWTAYQLSDNLLFSGVCSVPGAMKKFLQGEFDLKAVDGTQVGKLVVSENSAWGLRPLFRRRGGEAGDYLALLFDLPEKKVVAYLGDSTLLDEFQVDDEALPIIPS